MEINHSNQENNNSSQNKSNYFKVTLTLPEELDHLLFEIGQTARSKGGHRLPKTLIIRSLIRILKEINVDLNGIKSEDQFYEKLMEAIRMYNKKKENSP